MVPQIETKGKGSKGYDCMFIWNQKISTSVDRKKRSPALMNLLNLNNLKTDWLIKIRFSKGFFSINHQKLHPVINHMYNIQLMSDLNYIHIYIYIYIYIYIIEKAGSLN